MEEFGICTICGAAGKMYTCKLCGRNVCLGCITFRNICRECLRGKEI